MYIKGLHGTLSSVIIFYEVASQKISLSSWRMLRGSVSCKEGEYPLDSDFFILSKCVHADSTVTCEIAIYFGVTKTMKTNGTVMSPV